MAAMQSQGTELAADERQPVELGRQRLDQRAPDIFLSRKLELEKNAFGICEKWSEKIPSACIACITILRFLFFYFRVWLNFYQIQTHKRLNMNAFQLRQEKTMLELSA